MKIFNISYVHGGEYMSELVLANDVVEATNKFLKRLYKLKKENIREVEMKYSEVIV